MDLISIVVPVYNTKEYLEKCITSILAQTYRDLEVILVDDGSTDGSGELCDLFARKDERIRVIHKANGGLSSARNAGMNVATGTYIGFVDSDDRIASDMYEKLLCALNGQNDRISNIMYVREYPDGTTAPSPVPHTQDESFSAEAFARELMLHVGDVSVWSKLFPAGLIRNIRFCEGKLNEDLLFMMELMPCIKEICFVGTVGYYYGVREKSISSGYGKTVVDMVDNALIAKQAVVQLFPGLKKEAERFALYQHMAYLLMVPSTEAVKANTVYTDAVRYVRKNTFFNLGNRFLTFKQKIILCGLTVCPRLVAKIFKTKN